jgi:hypothetical protein
MAEHREHGLHMRNAKQYLIPTHSTKSRTTELHGGPVNCLSDIPTYSLPALHSLLSRLDLSAAHILDPSAWLGVSATAVPS